MKVNPLEGKEMQRQKGMFGDQGVTIFVIVIGTLMCIGGMVVGGWMGLNSTRNQDGDALVAAECPPTIVPQECPQCEQCPGITPCPPQEDCASIDAQESELVVPDQTEEISQPIVTEWIVVVNCPECEGIPLALWQEPGNMGVSPGKVNHDDTCIVLDTGEADGVEKYKINCDGKIGWLRAEGLVTK